MLGRVDSRSGTKNPCWFGFAMAVHQWAATMGLLEESSGCRDRELREETRAARGLMPTHNTSAQIPSHLPSFFLSVRLPPWVWRQSPRGGWRLTQAPPGSTYPNVIGKYCTVPC